MNDQPAKASLVIIVDGNEVPGLLVYGLMAPQSRRFVSLPVGTWSPSSRPSEYVLHGENWEVLIWDIEIDIWPRAAHWEAAVRATLQAMVDNGARVAWVGGEGVPFADPPSLFRADRMAGSVLAWMTDDGAFGLTLDPEKPIQSADAATLERLRAYGHGLTDVP